MISTKNILHLSIIQVHTIFKAAEKQRISDYMIKKFLQVLDTYTLWVISLMVGFQNGRLDGTEVPLELPSHFKHNKLQHQVAFYLICETRARSRSHYLTASIM